MADEITPRQRIRDCWHQRIDTGEPLDLKEDAPRIALQLRQDESFCAAFLDAFLSETVYTVGLNLLSQGRGSVVTRRLSADDVRDAIDEEQPDWSKWTEYDPTSKTHIRLLDMTKEQLIDAALTREGRGDTEYRRAALARLVAGRLQPGQVAHSVWSEDELTVIYDRIELKRPKTALKPLQNFLKGAAD